MQFPVSEEFFAGAVSIERIDGCMKPWRVDHSKKLLFPSDEAETFLDRMEFTTGIRLRFETDAARVKLNVLPEEDGRNFDLVGVQNTLVETFLLPPGEKTVKFTLSGEGNRFEIWLPQGAPAVIKGFVAEDGYFISPVPDKRPRWTAYGSSITQCSAARSPAMTWPGIAARKHNLNLTCLGFGGNCHCEPMTAMMLRDLPADIITLKLGINIHGESSLSPRTFKPAAIGLVRLIREKHPRAPIGVISPIICPSREETANSAGFTLKMMRDELENAVLRIRKATGDDRIFYFDGRELFGEGLAGKHLPDGLHPDAAGYELMGLDAAEKVLPVLLENIHG